MKKFTLFFIFFYFIFNIEGNAFADNHIITIQCKVDGKEGMLLHPIYVINTKTKKVKVGSRDMHLVNHKFTPKRNLEEEILIGSNAYKSHTLMTINRLTGRYYTKMTILGYTKDTETIIEQTGTCMKYEKAF